MCLSALRGIQGIGKKSCGIKAIEQKCQNTLFATCMLLLLKVLQELSLKIILTVEFGILCSMKINRIAGVCGGSHSSSEMESWVTVIHKNNLNLVCRLWWNDLASLPTLGLWRPEGRELVRHSWWKHAEEYWLVYS